MKYSLLRGQPVNCRYQLSFRNKSSDENYAFVFRIHRSVTDLVPELHENTPIVERLAGSCNVEADSVTDDLTRGFGFGGLIQRDQGNESGGYITLTAELPPATQGNCLRCGGSGELLSGEDCSQCDGSGRAIKASNSLEPMIASINLLLSALNQINSRGDSNRKQLLVVNVMMSRESSGIQGVLSSKIVDWVADIKRELFEVEKVMQSAYELMAGNNLYDSSTYFNAKTEKGSGRLGLSCPGDRSGLNPPSTFRKKEAYELVPHNIDTPLQVLTLLSGLAALEDKVRV